MSLKYIINDTQQAYKTIEQLYQTSQIKFIGGMKNPTAEQVNDINNLAEWNNIPKEDMLYKKWLLGALKGSSKEITTQIASRCTEIIYKNTNTDDLKQKTPLLKILIWLINDISILVPTPGSPTPSQPAHLSKPPTTLYEIIQLRQIDPKFRQSYKEDEESPTIPVISAIINGIETNNLNRYYYEVSQLFLHKDTLILGDEDFDKRIDTDNTTSNYIVNNKLNKQKILNEN